MSDDFNQMTLGDCKIGQRISYFNNKGERCIATVIAYDTPGLPPEDLLLGWKEGEEADPLAWPAGDFAAPYVNEALEKAGCVCGMWRDIYTPVNLV